MPRKIAEATADLRTIAAQEFPQYSNDSLITFGDAIHVLHTVDGHRQRVENKRADKRNNYRLTMLYVTLGLWMLSAFTFKILCPALIPFSPAIPLLFDLALQHWNKHIKV